MLPVTKRYQLTKDLSICPLLNGMWQVSGTHGLIDHDAAIEAMLAYHDSGLTTWDLADHYGPAEDFIGEFRRRLAVSRGESELAGIQSFTKWVPQPGRMTRATVEAAIGRSLRRMNVESIDLLQFHWWDYSDTSYLDALKYLADMREDGKIKYLALTNFDTEHMQKIVDLGIPIVSNQVQFSLIDRRPEVNMTNFCRQHGIHLLAYGTLCGGLLSERYLGQPEPAYRDLNTSSLQKYKRMIDAWGGWTLFQHLLAVLKGVADAGGVSIADVGLRYILDRPSVAGVIVGVRLGVTDHREDNARVFDFSLTRADTEEIETVLARSADLYHIIGDCGDEYRH